MNRRHYKLETGCNSNARTAKSAKTPKTANQVENGEIGEIGENKLNEIPHAVRNLNQLEKLKGIITSIQDEPNSARVRNLYRLEKRQAT